MSTPGFRAQVEAIFAEEAVRRAAFLGAVPEEVRAWVPFDATPHTRAIELLAEAVGVGDAVAALGDAGHRANPAVLLGRVYGRGARLDEDAILGAFAAGAQVRAGQLARLAEAVDGLPLRREVEVELAAAGDDLAAVFPAQERVLLHLGARLDTIGA